MHDAAFAEAINKICEKDGRYEPDAYFFVREALFFTAKMLDKPSDGPGRHVTGQELLEGARGYALQEFGPMALTVLNTWGIKRAEDFGEIVFNLVQSGQLGKTEQDRREDFAGGYDFTKAFSMPFQPQSPLSQLLAKRRPESKRAPRRRRSGDAR